MRRAFVPFTPSALPFALGVISALLFALCSPLEAQQSGKISRVGFVSAGSSSVRIDALRQGLRELGWVEGKDILFERRQAEGKPGHVPALAAELIRLNVDVLVLSGGVEAAKQIKTIPIVFVATADLLSTGLVQSLAWPGKNVTGVTSLAPELSGKRLELLKETVPKLSRVAFLFNSNEPSNVIELEQLRRAANALGLMLRKIEARSNDDIERAFATMTHKRVEGFSTASGAINNTNRRAIVDLVNVKRLPAIYHESQFADDGGLMSYGPNLVGMFQRAAYFVDRILKGAKPGDLPVEQPTKFELVINLKTAKQIGLAIPPHVLARADRVIR